jgi:cytochrome c-type biogenesis protein CcmH
MNEPTDWVSAIAILASGLILGLLFVTAFNRRRSTSAAAPASDLELLDLEAKRDALVAQLRALAPDETEERARLERETAAVLRKIDGHAPRATASAAPVAAAAPAPSKMSPALQGVLWGAGTFLLFSGLAYFVMKQSTPREQQTGMTPAPAAQQQPQQAATDPVVQQLEAAVKANPNDLEQRIMLAQAYLERDNLMGVFEQTRAVLDKNPNHPRAMTFNALVRLAMGEVDVAQQMLERSTKIDPKNMDGWVALAWVHAQRGKMKEAEIAIATARQESPADAARLDEILVQMKAAAAQNASNTLPADHPPVAGGAPAAAPAGAASGRSVRITLSLDPAAKTRTGVVYVMARNAGGGPPVAVKRLDASQLPLTFDLGEADSMMGQPLPDQFRVEARLDSDGDAASKAPTDPVASQDAVRPGATIALSLR